MNREHDPVELVDDGGTAIGTCPVAVAHRAPGVRHRAISVLVIGSDGRLLLQRRAADKTRFALRWANTCCGHPPPGSDTEPFARRRLTEEMGLHLARLELVGTFTYQAIDAASGFAEHEYDHTYLGYIDDQAPGLEPDPREVADWAWVPASQLRNALNGTAASHEERYVPWLRQLLLIARAI